MNLLKLWKPNNTTATMQPTMPIKAAQCHNNNEEEEDDSDSFIELELTLPNYDAKIVKVTKPPRNAHAPVLYKTDTDSEFSSKRASTASSSSCEDTAFYRAFNGVEDSATDICRLRSRKTMKSPAIRRLMLFKEDRTSKTEMSETENAFAFSPRRSESRSSRGTPFPVKFRRSNSNSSKMSTDSAVDERAGVGKYLTLLSPSHYIKRRRSSGEGAKEVEDFSGSPARKWWMPSPIHEIRERKAIGRRRSRFGVMDRWSVGKSRSESQAVVGCSPASRMDESSEQRKDGIQSAILHCKMSLNDHRDGRCSSLSRCTEEEGSQEEESVQRQ
ncbi:hypothetical protein Drorol1_Dr00013163 [Drosera rotundifolia]